MEKIVDIIESIANEKKLQIQDVKERVVTAITNTAKKIYGYEFGYDVKFDSVSKTVKLYQKILILDNEDERLKEECKNFISLNDAKQIDSSLEIGDALTYELSFDNLGRTAAGILSKELDYHIQKLIEEKIFDKYKQKIGKIIFGVVTHIDSDENTFIEVDDIKAIMPRKNRIKGEKFKVGSVVKAVIKNVYMDKIYGVKVEISRTTPKFLEALLSAEVPEIKDGSVIIQASSRIPGERAKIAVTSSSPNVDPVGATVGTKGVRINAVSSELNGENIDVIEFAAQPEIFISRAMSPAIVSSVKIDDKKAIVSLVSEQKSKAIGKSGINIRLASMLTGYEIELNEIVKNANTTTSIEDNVDVKKSNDLTDLKKLFGDL
ncbi:transcription elongation factor NusA [Campylobacter sputorum subsp. bubulus]|uniref:Transcription termination/antitermination protein NusA n=1 Tax=Campylobacter sputorum subsp. sputorum TaxID=32024 RepID=A0A381DIP9_9BACT|nr:transcription termination factor NusA [Campylobacter sputorum]ASM35440.1 transcription termination factor [Campylobacter sputorum aubsp. sputorum RM3237]KAB0582821.1 transcription termination/antitermination protein NusA [Campylobacter sputorum subsp. sputorum]QEL05632.1 transcription termination factor [Campylobacter sputorum subsp. sputorum]SUX08481.1 transcription elongation factor NusA [Campylobacter sputorum subsp. bubulus]SUX10397.1 transcription elongation factor NusA [Campylobacter 